MATTTTTPAQRHFYAISHAYGKRTVHANTGRRIGQYYAFATAAERDAWVDADDSYNRHPEGTREAISGSDRELRGNLRRAETEIRRRMEPLTLDRIWDEAGVREWYEIDGEF